MPNLTGAISATARFLPLDSAYEATSRFSYVECGAERMYVVRGDGTALLYVRRGQAGTTAVAHASGAAVTAVGGSAGPHSHTHAAATGQTAGDHHAQAHAASHGSGEADDLTALFVEPG